VELDWNEDYEGIKNTSIQELIKKGIADKHLLEKRWSEELDILNERWSDELNTFDLSHLCLILQAYCLIFPIHSQDKENESVKCSAKYLIPCKLPDRRDGPAISEEEFAFYDFKVIFDFKKFLPSEVYHRFICWLLMLAKREDDKNSFTQRHTLVVSMKG